MIKANSSLFAFGDEFFFPNCPDDIPSPDEVRQHRDVIDNGVVRFVDRRLIVKYGPLQDNELHCHWLAWKFSGVPVPAIYAWYRDGGDAFLYMELVDGVTLQERWETLSAPDRQTVARSLRDMLLSLRANILPPDDKFIGSLPRGPCLDGILRSMGCGLPGPFASTKAFNDRIVSEPNGHTQSLSRDVRKALPDDSPIVFTHNNIHLTNIFVSRPGEKLAIRAIIDWENAGFYPAYWEAISMMMCEGRYYHDRIPFIETACRPDPSIWQKWKQWLDVLAV